MPIPREIFPEVGPRLGPFIWPRALAWTALMGVFVLLGVFGANLERRRVALAEARASYNKDLAYRRWAADRGGVYVPLDGRTEANPHLATFPDRDVVTTGGKRLTLVNPAYMTRMVYDESRKNLGIHARIISEHPLRPENRADPWEIQALRKLEASGETELWEMQPMEGEPHLRFIGALKVEASCLTCHSQQGYEVGQMRGGLSMAVALQPLAKVGSFPGMQALGAGLLGLWLVGLAGLLAWGHHWASLARLEAASEADRIGAEQYRGILQNTVDGFLHLDAAGRILDVNEGYLQLSGYARPDLLYMRIQDLEADPREGASAEFNRRKLAEVGERRVTRHRAKDGRIWIVEASLSPVSGGRTWVAMLRDMTREFQARQALEDSEQRLLNAQRIAHIGFWERDLDSDQLSCSRETFRILGLEPTPDGVIQASDLYTLIHPEDRAHMEGLFQKVAKGGAPFRGEIRIQRPDGSLRYLETQAEIFLGRGGRGLRIIRTLFDITERREAETEKRRLELEVQHAQKLESLGSLAGGVAHDMNNVLGAIFMVASGLQEQRGEDAPLMKSMDLVMSAAGRGRDLVRGLTEFARKGVEEPTHVDLNQLVRREMDLLRHTTLQKIELIEELDPSLPGIQGDPSSLANALMNLCVNAMDAMPEGGRLRLATRALESGLAELVVEDSGLGMPPEVLQRATEPFFTTKPLGKGTGLGLAMVYGVAKAHGGTLDIRSVQGGGTTISLRFPGVVPLPAASLPLAEAKASFLPLRILLVDDDDLIRNSVPAMLQGLGHGVEGAASGLEALRRLEHGRPVDVVILDLNMPGLTGLETLARLRLLEPDLPVIISSGYVEGDAEALLMGDPAVSFLAKPYTLRDLRRRLERIPSRSMPGPT
jgi:PAS domain S-box-containing protein